MNTDKITNLLDQETIKYLFSIFHNYKSEIRLVGGSIRDTLIDRDVKDIDSATSLEPDEVLVLLKIGKKMLQEGILHSMRYILVLIKQYMIFTMGKKI